MLYLQYVNITQYVILTYHFLLCMKKIDKYKDLCVELLSLWRVHCEVIPLVIGGLGCITNKLQGYLQRLEINPFCTVEP